MSWLLRHNWLWSLLAFLFGAAITWFLLVRREQPAPAPVDEEPEPAEEKEEVLVGAAVGAQEEPRPAPVAEVPRAPEPVFSRRMDAERIADPTLFDEDTDEADSDTDATGPQVRADLPPGRYGEGSADAVPHQGPPDGFTIKGNAHSMLFHTPDSPYYGRTKPEVWFRSEADAERAGFTKYARRPRKSANPND